MGTMSENNAERIAEELARERVNKIAKRDARYAELTADLGWIHDLLSQRMDALGTGTQAVPHPDRWGATYYAIARSLEHLDEAIKHAQAKDGSEL